MKKIILFLSIINIGFIHAQIVYIPDANFKQALIDEYVDTNGDGEIQVSEAESITYLFELYSKDISDLTGIESFINLIWLDCSYNYIYSLDISSNTVLTDLNCSGNSISSLDISSNTALIDLDCSSNSISSLDLSNNTALTDLDCGFNNISSLDVSNLNALTDLDCSGNDISSLNLSYNTALTDLDCSGNDISSLDISYNTALTDLDCSDLSITNLTDIIGINTGLLRLSCGRNDFTTLDVTAYTDLKYLYFGFNMLTNIDLSQNTELIQLGCYNNLFENIDLSHQTDALTWLNIRNNPLSSIDVSQNGFLHVFSIDETEIIELDVSNNPELYNLSCRDNPNLVYINLKNGNNENFTFSYFENLPNLNTVCIDELGSPLSTHISDEVEHEVTFTEYCSFVHVLDNDFNGIVRLDMDANACDTSDLALSNLMLVADNGSESFATFTQNTGEYLLYTNEGVFNTSITTSLPAYFTIDPNSYTHTFSGISNSYTADFCLEANQVINDVNCSIQPLNQARPSFDANYQIVYKNVGTTQLNGDVTLVFDDTKLSFVEASETPITQTSNSLSFNYTDLNPFETRSINIKLHVFAPPTVEIDDILHFITTVNPIAGDNTTDDNVFEFNQTVVGSYDPNDMIVLEGKKVLIADKDKYLHYTIRFQNTGTASAINVVVTNDLDTNLDWSTLQLEKISHENRVDILNGNEIEFIFENINLPDSTSDEPNSHGYISYKIKPKSSVALGDIIYNKADIFFDFNEAISTNIVDTRFVSFIGYDETKLVDFSVYPVPTNKLLKIESKSEIAKIEIFNKLGQKVYTCILKNKIDISNLSEGLYFLKVTDKNDNTGIKKIIKK